MGDVVRRARAVRSISVEGEAELRALLNGGGAVVCSACGYAQGHARSCPQPEAPRRRARARTVSIARLSKRELERGRLENPTVVDVERPRTRADCLPGGCNEERPCPFVSCKHHLFLGTNERTGSIKFNFPDLDLEDLAETCELDVADRGGLSLEAVGALANLTRERVRQVEVRALAKLGERLTRETGETDERRYLPVLRCDESVDLEAEYWGRL